MKEREERGGAERGRKEKGREGGRERGKGRDKGREGGREEEKRGEREGQRGETQGGREKERRGREGAEGGPSHKVTVVLQSYREGLLVFEVGSVGIGAATRVVGTDLGSIYHVLGCVT